MPSIDYAAVKSRVTYAEVLGLIGWRHCRRAAGWYRGPCPLRPRHEGPGDCFSVREGGWICHRCKRHGDQLRLWSEWTGQLLYPATLELCRRLGIEI